MSDALTLNADASAQLIESIHGLRLEIPLTLIRRLGDLEMAAFVGLAAWLSSCCVAQEGWFFLEQEKEPEPSSASMFRRIGSWKSSVGLGKDAQLRARRGLEKLGLLYAIPSARQRKLLRAEAPAPVSAFIFEQPRGAPPRLHYKVDYSRYLVWLSRP